ncbi:hypothetical protein KIN20_033857 [Parelaphostrongylus tenuis]|uniref:Uncharacterized protein n=1 Tax=Parelaphostrongylus tenuis TaxID=148309 RepID=A0AAD5WJK2_PARTN|nr:hypothetical protein KIN20_033857 [Parelaphostrongylus tenuis]
MRVFGTSMYFVISRRCDGLIGRWDHPEFTKVDDKSMRANVRDSREYCEGQTFPEETYNEINSYKFCTVRTHINAQNGDSFPSTFDML